MNLWKARDARWWRCSNIRKEGDWHRKLVYQVICCPSYLVGPIYFMCHFHQIDYWGTIWGIRWSQVDSGYIATRHPMARSPVSTRLGAALPRMSSFLPQKSKPCSGLLSVSAMTILWEWHRIIMDTAGSNRATELCGPSDRANNTAARGQMIQFLNPMLRVCFLGLFLDFNYLSVGFVKK